MPQPIAIFWFRRDLRLNDNAGLYHALQCGYRVLPLFVFDTNILDKLEEKTDRRVEFIHHALTNLQRALNALGSNLRVEYGAPVRILKKLTEEFTIKAVFANHDYEPYARERDKQIEEFLKSKDISLHTFKDQVIFEKNEVVKDDGTPYTIFTPYSRKWKSALTAAALRSYPVENHQAQFLQLPPGAIPSLRDITFQPAGMTFPSASLDSPAIKKYHQTRDYPGINGTSRLGVHLRFGTISVRDVVRLAQKTNETFLNELIWREFFMAILWHFPHVVDNAFKPAYNTIKWRNNEDEFHAWCTGNTGYPIVDAGMRELNATGFMHNRARMIVASFLSKDLLIDWRWGEAYFAQKLLDFELSSNNGGWQWSAGTGCDAAPYFRIFNPDAQAKKFDPDHLYVSRWVPEWKDRTYPQPIVDHKAVRVRCLQAYKKALGNKEP